MRFSREMPNCFKKYLKKSGGSSDIFTLPGHCFHVSDLIDLQFIVMELNGFFQRPYSKFFKTERKKQILFDLKGGLMSFKLMGF